MALFREASKDDASENEVPIDQAVSIGTKLQLRATINSDQSGSKLIFINIHLWEVLHLYSHTPSLTLLLEKGALMYEKKHFKSMSQAEAGIACHA